MLAPSWRVFASEGGSRHRGFTIALKHASSLHVQMLLRSGLPRPAALRSFRADMQNRRCQRFKLSGVGITAACYRTENQVLAPANQAKESGVHELPGKESEISSGTPCLKDFVKYLQAAGRSRTSSGLCARRSQKFMVIKFAAFGGCVRGGG